MCLATGLTASINCSSKEQDLHGECDCAPDFPSITVSLAFSMDCTDRFIFLLADAHRRPGDSADRLFGCFVHPGQVRDCIVALLSGE